MQARLAQFSRPLRDEADKLTRDTGFEWGVGVYLQKDGTFKSTGLYTDDDAGFVCPRNGEGVWVLDLHSHTAEGQPQPSGFLPGTRGGDRQTATNHPTVFFQLTQPGGQRYDYTQGVMKPIR